MAEMVLMIEAIREVYSVDDVLERTMTVGELIDYLQEFDEDAKIVFSHDSGYTYGGIRRQLMSEEYYGDEESDD